MMQQYPSRDNANKHALRIGAFHSGRLISMPHKVTLSKSATLIIKLKGLYILMSKIAQNDRLFQ